MLSAMAVAPVSARSSRPQVDFSASTHAKHTPYGLPVVEDIRDCDLGPSSFLEGLSPETKNALNDIQHMSAYPENAVVLMEGQSARGVFIVCQGRVKLMTTNTEGKTLIVKIAHPGEIIGLQAVVTGHAYELTAETLQPTQLAYIGREQFLKFIKVYGDACLRATQHLSHDCDSAYDVIRSIGLGHSVPGKLARLLLQWSAAEGRSNGGVVRMKMGLTHEELAQLIGSSRETVTRILGDFKRNGMLEMQGATLVIRNTAKLQSLCTS
jgi:CRP/FNR family transcriptional regulator, cyclic AMP receptor protein